MSKYSSTFLLITTLTCSLLTKHISNGLNDDHSTAEVGHFESVSHDSFDGATTKPTNSKDITVTDYVRTMSSKTNSPTSRQKSSRLQKRDAPLDDDEELTVGDDDNSYRSVFLTPQFAPILETSEVLNRENEDGLENELYDEVPDVAGNGISGLPGYDDEEEQEQELVERYLRAGEPSFRLGKRPGPSFRLGKRDGPTFRLGKRDGPTFRLGKRNGPTFRLGKRDGPTFRLGKRNGPTFRLGKRDGPTFRLGKRDGPTFRLGKRDGPTFRLGKKSGPTFRLGKKNGPTFRLGKRDGPTFRLGKRSV